MEANEEDGGRPPLGVVDHIRALFDKEGLCRDNTCVQTVKDFYTKAGIEAMPKDVYNNREFLKNFKEYGFEEILDHKNLQPGDILQYYYGPDSEDVKEYPSYLNFPYHMGVYVNPGEYIGDGDSEAPIQRQNMYRGIKDGKEYKKDPFKAFRYIKQNKNGSDVEKAQWGKLLKLAKKYGNKLLNYSKPAAKVVDAANTVKKTDKVVSNSLNPLEIADQIIPRFNVLGPVGGDIMQLSPLNAIPFYGKNLKGKNMAFRKFGNSIYDVIQRQALSPVGGSDFRMGKNQIVSEGNWAAMSRPSENYSGVFEATFDFNNPFANLSPTGISQRNGVLITDKLGNRLTEIPLTEPGLSFNRRLPFSTRYVPIDKQKLIDDKSQLATFGPRLQSLAEKYGIGLLGAHLVGEEDTYNKYTIDPIIENTEKSIQ